MKRTLSLLLVALVSSVLLFAGKSSLSVPLASDAYRIIENAEIRGIIPQQSQARPYSVALVRSLFSEILASGSISESEKAAIEDLEAGFVQSYGAEANTSLLSAVEKYGYLTLVDTEDVKVSLGGKFSNEDSVAFGDVSASDIRNKITAYVRGDFWDTVSFYMDFSLLFDKIDHRAFLATDFTSDIEGWYQDFGNGGKKIMVSPFSGIGNGLAMSPEIAASLLDDTLLLRFGAIQRDWGPGRNNLALSASARSFDGVEFTYAPSSAFSFSWLLGSLGKSYLTLTGEPSSPDNSVLHDNQYDNNFTSQRVEVSPIKGLRAAIYETVVWRKRFELAYMNPLGVYMFSQNYVGDFDNMMAGVDLSYSFGNIGKAYFSLAIDEYNSVNPKTWFTFARNIVAAQGGVKVALPFLSFSQFTLQATYLPPFFGTHYTFSTNPWGPGSYSLDYVNKGKSLSYPMYPDSLELLASFETSLPSGVSVDLTIKDQMRSAQYASNDLVGTDYSAIFDYGHTGNYVDKNLFGFLWRNTLDVSLTGRKTIRDFSVPVSVSAGVECLVDSKRPYTVATTSGTVAGTPYEFNYGNGTTFTGEWTTDVRFIGHIGVSLYY